MTELCAGNLIINAIITNFLKVIILFAHNPHTQTQKRARTWSSTRATPIALFSPPLLPYLFCESELVVSAAATSSSSTRRKTSNFSKLAATFLPLCFSSYFKFRPLPRMTHCRLILFWWANEAYFGGSGSAHSQLGGKVGEGEKKKLHPSFCGLEAAGYSVEFHRSLRTVT